MRKKLILLILVLSIVLCILLGYCVSANLRADKKEQKEPSDVKELALDSEKEIGNPTLEAEVSTSRESEEEQATEGTAYTTEQLKTEPPVTESPATNPPVSAPTTEETTATEPPTTENMVEPTPGENQLPGI